MIAKGYDFTNDKNHIKEEEDYWYIKFIISVNGELPLKMAKYILSYSPSKVVKYLAKENIDYFKGCVCYACKYCSQKIVATLIKHGCDINEKDKEGRTPLISAVSNTENDIVKLLLDEDGIDIKATDTNGFNALFYAAFKSNENAVKLLVKRISPNTTINDEIYPISYSKSDTISYILLKNMSAEHIKRYADYQTFKRYLKKDSESLEIILNAVPELLFTKIKGKIPLFTAVKSKAKHNVKVLLEKDVDKRSIEEIDKSGNTALFYAVINETADITSLLLEFGFSKTVKNYKKFTPIDYANEHNTKVLRKFPN